MLNHWWKSISQNTRTAAFATACLAPLMMGCPQGDGYREMGAKDDVKNTEAHDHHHEAGPHGGHIIELGEYHGEVAVDKDRVLTLYILGADAATAAPIADASAKVQAKIGTETKEIVLVAAPLEGETDGKTSRFTAAADALPAEIIDIEDLEGNVILIVADKETTASLAHDHDHDHDHDHKDEKAPAK